MANFFILRLGADSESDIIKIDACREGISRPFQIDIKCKQVPKDVVAGVFVVIWLGTNNNKGGRTPWIQGVRAFGTVIGLSGAESYNSEKIVAVSVGVVLQDTITKTDFVKKTNVLYQQITAMPVLGVNNYSSQVVQRIDPSDPDQDIPSLFKAIEILRPGFITAVLSQYPSLDKLVAACDVAIVSEAPTPLSEQSHRIAENEKAIEDSLEEEDLLGTGIVVKPWNPNDIRITTKSFSIRELFTQINESELDLAPDFQRAFVWKENQQVRLVESILLGIPLPAFYFNQDKTGAHQVVDGVQRLTTIKHFMSDILELNEDYLEYLGDLKGLKFSTLDPITRRRFGATQIVAHVIEPQTPDEVKYDIFSRVNTGGSPLEAQEIRHCMSKPGSREFLRRLVENENFDQVMGKIFWSRDQSGQLVRDNKRMSDREMALRFCAFYTIQIEEYSPSLDRFLLDFTRRIDQQSSQPTHALNLKAIEAAFEQAMKNSYAIMGPWAFRRAPLESNRRGPLNRAVFESQAVALAHYPLAVLLPYKEAIQREFRALFSDPDYDNAVRFGTGDYRKVERRITMPRETLARILS